MVRQVEKGHQHSCKCNRGSPGWRWRWAAWDGVTDRATSCHAATWAASWWWCASWDDASWCRWAAASTDAHAAWWWWDGSAWHWDDAEARGEASGIAMMVVHFEILPWLNLLTAGWVRRILWADQCFLMLFLIDCRRLWRIGSAVAAIQIRQAVCSGLGRIDKAL